MLAANSAADNENVPHRASQPDSHALKDDGPSTSSGSRLSARADPPAPVRRGLCRNLFFEVCQQTAVLDRQAKIEKNVDVDIGGHRGARRRCPREPLVDRGDKVATDVARHTDGMPRPGRLETRALDVT